MPPLRLPLFAFSLFIRSSSALQVTPSPNKTPRRLLAIDVGLRCGFATYDDFGFLLDFSSTHFSTRAELVENMPLILHTAATLPPATALTNVVLEGVPELCEEWRASRDVERALVAQTGKAQRPPGEICRSSYCAANHHPLRVAKTSGNSWGGQQQQIKPNLAS